MPTRRCSRAARRSSGAPRAHPPARRQVLVVEHAAGLAAAAQVHAEHGVPVPGEVGVDAASRAARCRPPCGMGCTRGWPAPGPPRRPRGARCGHLAGCRRPAGSRRGRSGAPGAEAHRSRASADRRSEQLVRVRVERRRRRPAAAAFPSTLNTPPSSRTGPTPGCSTVWTRPFARTCSSSKSCPRPRTSLAGTRRAASAVTAARRRGARSPPPRRERARHAARARARPRAGLRVRGERVLQPEQLAHLRAAAPR